MASVSLKAHYDGQRILLDEPYDLPRDAPLIVTVLSPEPDAERADWIAEAERSLARAYGDDEPEYSIEDAEP